MTQWKLRRRGRTVGPIPTSELLRALQLGKVPIDSEAQRVGEDGWAPLAEFAEFAEEIARDTPTHIMSSPWFLDSSPPPGQAKVADTDPTEILLEPTPLPSPAVLRSSLPAPNPPATFPVGGPSPRAPMATVPDPAPLSHFQLDLASETPGFVTADEEPVTPRVSDHVVPAAAVPTAEEISAQRTRASVRAAAQSSAPPERDAEQSESKGLPTAGTSPPPISENARSATSSQSPVADSPGRDSTSPTADRFNLVRTALGGPASPLNVMLAQIGRGNPASGLTTGLPQSPETEPHPPVELTPLSGTPILSQPTVEPIDASDAGIGPPPAYLEDELQEAVLDGDGESSPNLGIQPGSAAQSPDGMNRVESYGPAPIPSAERRGAMLEQETTSPALRSPRVSPTGGGRNVLWFLILVLTAALVIAGLAILIR